MSGIFCSVTCLLTTGGSGNWLYLTGLGGTTLETDSSGFGWFTLMHWTSWFLSLLPSGFCFCWHFQQWTKRWWPQLPEVLFWRGRDGVLDYSGGGGM